MKIFTQALLITAAIVLAIAAFLIGEYELFSQAGWIRGILTNAVIALFIVIYSALLGDEGEK